MKGYVGMLEIEVTLHKTATYTIPFADSSTAQCAALETAASCRTTARHLCVTPRKLGIDDLP